MIAVKQLVSQFLHENFFLYSSIFLKKPFSEDNMLKAFKVTNLRQRANL